MNWDKIMRNVGKFAVLVGLWMFAENIVSLWNNGYNNFANPYMVLVYLGYSLPYLVVLLPLGYLSFKKTN